MKWLAGIGSRETPTDVLDLMTRIGHQAGTRDWGLSSGGAIGADKAFEVGFDRAGAQKRIWNPATTATPTQQWAVNEVQKYCIEAPLYPIKPYVQQLLIRNMYIILGIDEVTPVSR